MFILRLRAFVRRLDVLLLNQELETNRKEGRIGLMLEILVDANLVTIERNGRERIYLLNGERLDRVVGGWLAWFKKGSANEA